MKKLLTLLLLAATGGLANTIVSFTGLPPNTDFGTFNGFAQGTVNGVANQLLVCDDFNHETYVPSENLVFSLSLLTGANPLEYARFAMPGDLAGSIFKYEEAALLVEGLKTTPSQTADYQYALWHLFTPSVPLPDVTSQRLLDQVALQVQSGSPANEAVYAHLRIYTPVGGYASNQEFLTLTSNPEPETLVLVAIGVLAIVASRGLKRRQRRSGDARP